MACLYRYTYKESLEIHFSAHHRKSIVCGAPPIFSGFRNPLAGAASVARTLHEQRSKRFFPSLQWEGVSFPEIPFTLTRPDARLDE